MTVEEPRARGLFGADDERLACCVNDLGGDRVEVVDVEDPPGLG
jgi:hypothetical protein